MDTIEGMRKLIFALVALVCVTILTLVGKFSPELAKEVIIWIGVTFVAGNGVEYIAKVLETRQ